MTEEAPNLKITALALPIYGGCRVYANLCCYSVDNSYFVDFWPYKLKSKTVGVFQDVAEALRFYHSELTTLQGQGWVEVESIKAVMKDANLCECELDMIKHILEDITSS